MQSLKIRSYKLNRGRGIKDGTICKNHGRRIFTNSKAKHQEDAIEDWHAVWLTVKSAALTDEATRKDLQAQIA